MTLGGGKSDEKVTGGGSGGSETSIFRETFFMNGPLTEKIFSYQGEPRWTTSGWPASKYARTIVKDFREKNTCPV